MKILELTPRDLDEFPRVLEEGILYMSEECELAAHKCCCGCGEDVFKFSSLCDSTDCEPDIITDFNQCEDLIDLSCLGFKGITKGEGDGCTLGYYVDGCNTIITDADSDFAIQLNGVYCLTNADFIF